jgi:mannose-6-phosphate isomerase-like protein (cupin superfamily)
MNLSPNHEPDKRSNLFGGEGEVLIWNLMGARPMFPFTALLLCELSPNGSVGAHVQQASHEMLLVVEGQGVATVGTTNHPLEPGAVIHLPLGERLALQNSSPDRGLRYLIIKATVPSG